MRHPATSIRRVVSAAVLLVVLGAYPAAAGTHSPTGDPAPQGMAVFEWYRLSQVNANVTEERLWSLRRDGFSVVYADLGEYLEAADSRGARASGASSGGWPATCGASCAGPRASASRSMPWPAGPTGPPRTTATWGR